jgi:DNA-binding MarR family transcriptional regulator
MVAPDTVTQLRGAVQRFVRGFGLLSEQTTPCGQPVSPREAHALMALRAHERAGRRAHLALLQHDLGIDKSNVTRVVQRLCDAGRVAAGTTDVDGRLRLLRLTPRGRRLADRLEHASAERFAALLARIPAAQHAAVLAAVTLLADAVPAPSASPTREPPHDEPPA